MLSSRAAAATLRATGLVTRILAASARFSRRAMVPAGSLTAWCSMSLANDRTGFARVDALRRCFLRDARFFLGATFLAAAFLVFRGAFLRDPMVADGIRSAVTLQTGINYAVLLTPWMWVGTVLTMYTNILVVLCTAIALLVSAVPRQAHGAIDPHVIHVVVKSLPGVVDEDHLDTVALAIAHAADNLTTCTPTAEKPDCTPEWTWGRTELVASLITMGYWESRFIRRIGAGNCHKWECDATKMPDGRIIHRARGFYQVQQSGLVKPHQWRNMVGITYDAQLTAAEVSGRIMSRNRARCNSRSGMISAYARGIGCTWPGAGVRELFLRRVLDKLAATEQQVRADSEAAVELPSS